MNNGHIRIPNVRTTAWAEARPHNAALCIRMLATLLPYATAEDLMRLHADIASELRQRRADK